MNSSKVDSRDSIHRYGYLAARIMLAAIFLLTGGDKLANRQDVMADIAEVGLPLPALLAVVAGVLKIGCGALLLMGKKTAWAAAGLLLFLLPVTVLFENPFRASADPGAVIDSLKNIAIMGGLVLVLLREDDWRSEAS